jgi:hypothetical protein
MIETHSTKTDDPSGKNDGILNEVNSFGGEKFKPDELINKEPESVTHLNPYDFNDFSYSKKSHFRVFHNNGYDKLLYGEDIDHQGFNIKTYQNLLVFSFITQNIPEGSRILEIGNGDDYIYNHFKFRYQIWRIENSGDLVYNKENAIQNEIQLFKDDKGKYHSDLPIGFFDFIFSTSGFGSLIDDKSLFKNVLDNINRMLKADGFSLHCFPVILLSGDVHYHRLLNFFCNHSYELFYPVRSLTSLPNKIEVLEDPELFLNFEIFTKAEELNLEEFQETVSYNYLWVKRNLELGETAITKNRDYISKDKIYIFHHLVKCGGTSVKEVIANWFSVQNDYLENSDSLNNFLRYKLNLSNLVSGSCVIGHFQNDKIHLKNRYPEIFENNQDYRIFTFIRDPLQIRFSMYYYNKKLFENSNINLYDSMKYFPDNFLASLFPCDESNYKEILGRYFFIGIVEDMQESFDKLANILDRKKLKLPYANRSEKDSQIKELPNDFISVFKENNRLDYLIYEYCLNIFSKYSIVYILFDSILDYLKLISNSNFTV